MRHETDTANRFPGRSIQRGAAVEMDIPTCAQSIEDFCKSNGISRSLFYKLLRQGRAPRIMKIGRRTLISSEAASEWRKAMETTL